MQSEAWGTWADPYSFDCCDLFANQTSVGIEINHSWLICISSKQSNLNERKNDSLRIYIGVGRRIIEGAYYDGV